MKTEGLTEACKWLKWLDGETRIIISDVRSASSHPRRHISPEEWERVQGLIREYELPCYLGHEPYGFSLLIYAHAEVQGKRPPFLLAIDDSQFPLPSAKKRGFAGQEETLAILSAITHTPRNTELLEWYGFRPLDPVTSYAY